MLPSIRLVCPAFVFLIAMSNMTFAQEAGVHRLFTDQSPPGLMGRTANQIRPATVGYIQPVQILAPKGTGLSMPVGGSFTEPAANANLQMGLMVGPVYRFRITEIPNAEGAELFPTIEVIDRTYPPPGLQLHYPIRIDIDQTDLEAALDGKMVTRVIYLEDTETASPIPQTEKPSFPYEAAEQDDALQIADQLGRPVAILRIGTLVPPRQPELLNGFYFGYPLWYPIEGVQGSTVDATVDNAIDFQVGDMTK